MTTIEDTLAKPVWPSLDPSLQEMAMALLAPLCARGTNDTVKIGFNESMRAIQSFESGKDTIYALFVARSDLHPAECLPLALASSAFQIRLISLPRGARTRLKGVGVIALMDHHNNTDDLTNLVENVGSAKADWTYRSAKTYATPKKSQARAK